MKTIADLKGAEFLRACNRVRHTVGDLLVKSDVMAIWKEEISLTGNESQEERKKIFEKESKEKIGRVLDLLLDEYAEETSAVLMDMCVLEDGEDPTGLDLAMVGLEIITTPKMVSFFTRLMKSAQSLGVG